MASKLTTAKRQSYTVSDKLRIIQFAEQNGNRAAEREFGVSESNVRLWRKSKENLEKMPRLKRANRGKKAAWPELEIDLLAWRLNWRSICWLGLQKKETMVLAIQCQRLKALELSPRGETGSLPMLHEKERSVMVRSPATIENNCIYACQMINMASHEKIPMILSQSPKGTQLPTAPHR